MSTKAKIWLILGFVSAFSAFTFYEFLKPVWDDCFYDLTTFAFVAYARVIYLQSKGAWSIVAFGVWLSCLSALIDELFCDPKVIEMNEYIAFVIMIVLILIQRKKWMR